MRIDSITNQYKTPYKPKFNGIVREVYGMSSVYPNKTVVKHRNTSFMLRPSLEYCKKLFQFFVNAFSDVKKVNVYNYGCSIGYETIGFLMGMFSFEKNNPQKFTPVMAKDYDEEIIKEAKKFILPLDYYERDLIGELVGKDNINEYVVPIKYQTYEQDLSGFLTKKIMDSIKYSVADIRNDYKNIEPDNSIVMASNFWPYMPKTDRTELANNLYKQLGKNSYVKIDRFDNEPNSLNDSVTTALNLIAAGFKETEIENLFVKK